MVIVIVGALTGCGHEGNRWVGRDMERFEKAFDDSLLISTSELPAAVVGKEYEFTLKAGGEPKPLRWRIVSGQLPDGMQLADDGAIGGTPNAPEVATFVVKVVCKSQPKPSALKEVIPRSDFLAAMGATLLPTKSPTQASVHQQNALRLFQSERFAEAAIEFQKAYQEGGDPALIFNAALCYRRTGDGKLAQVAFEEYLRKAPKKIPHRPTVEERIEAINRQLRSGGP